MSNTYPHEQLCSDFMDQYISEFGRQQFINVYEKIMTSDKISGLISRSRLEMKKPTAEHFMYAVPTISYFLLKRNKTVAMGCIDALLRWNDEVNAEYEMMGSDEVYQIVKTFLVKYRVYR